MKFKNFIGLCIACTAVVVMAVSTHAEKYAIGGSSGHVDGANKDAVEVPVMVIPNEGETASVNGYIMTFTYDSTKATPEEDTSNADSPYAKVGTKFNNGIIVSGVVDSADSTKGDKTLIVAWAAADAVDVAPNASADDETMATVKFDIQPAAQNDKEIPIHVEMAQLANDSETVKENVVENVVQGDIDLTDILYGDVDGNGFIDGTDASYILSYSVDSITESDLLKIYENAMKVADVDVNGYVDGTDASYILAKTVDSYTGDFPVKQ